MIDINRPILSFTDYLREAQDLYGAAPYVDPGYRKIESPFQDDPYGNNFRTRRDSGLGTLGGVDFDGGDPTSEAPDTGDLPENFEGFGAFIGAPLGFAVNPVGFAAGFGIDAARGKQDEPPGMLARALARLGRQIDNALDPYSYDPYDTTLDEFGPEAYGGGYGPEDFGSFDPSVGDPEDFGGGIGDPGDFGDEEDGNDTDPGDEF